MSREQRPLISGNWLYKDNEYTRSFASVVTLPEGAEDWLECTDEAKKAWEEEHNPKIEEPIVEEE